LEKMKTCGSVKALAKELGVARQLLYLWKQQAEGRKKASEPGGNEDPREQQIRELERKVGELEGVIGQKTLELDFFAGALRKIGESRQKKDKTGATASTPKSAGGWKRKAD
jgi:transposase-like protein